MRSTRACCRPTKPSVRSFRRTKISNDGDGAQPDAEDGTEPGAEEHRDRRPCAGGSGADPGEAGRPGPRPAPGHRRAGSASRSCRRRRRCRCHRAERARHRRTSRARCLDLPARRRPGRRGPPRAARCRRQVRLLAGSPPLRGPRRGPSSPSLTWLVTLAQRAGAEAEKRRRFGGAQRPRAAGRIGSRSSAVMAARLVRAVLTWLRVWSWWESGCHGSDHRGTRSSRATPAPDWGCATCARRVAASSSRSRRARSPRSRATPTTRCRGATSAPRASRSPTSTPTPTG